MSTAEMIQCAQCTFTTLTQKGLTIHLRKMHNVQTHNRKPRRTQNRRQGIRLANCSMSAKSWGLPFVCVICGYRTAEKLVIKEHVEQDHFKEDDGKFKASPGKFATYGNAVVQAGTSSGRDQYFAIPKTYREIMNCENVVVGFSSKPEPAEHMAQASIQYQPHPIQYAENSEQTYTLRQSNDVDANMDETCGGQQEDDDEYDDEDADE